MKLGNTIKYLFYILQVKNKKNKKNILGNTVFLRKILNLMH